MSTVPSRRRYVPIAVIAEHLGVTPRSVRNYIAKGLFPAYRIPGTRGVRLDLDQVNAAMKVIPATVARPGIAQFGPKARIIELGRSAPEPPGSETAEG
jgi:excisionase family DNA binding protein